MTTIYRKRKCILSIMSLDTRNITKTNNKSKLEYVVDLYAGGGSYAYTAESGGDQSLFGCWWIGEQKDVSKSVIILGLLSILTLFKLKGVDKIWRSSQSALRLNLPGHAMNLLSREGIKKGKDTAGVDRSSDADLRQDGCGWPAIERPCRRGTGLSWDSV